MSIFDMTYKFAIALVLGVVVAVGIGFYGDSLFKPTTLDEPIFDIASVGGPAGKDEGPQNALLLLAEADPSKGERVAKRCLSCHSFNEGGPNKTGPNLYGVVGRDVASVSGFAYSEPLKEHGGEWTYQRLEDYLADPAAAVPGNKMAFAGLSKVEDRAAMIAYLRTLAGEPAPMPSQEELDALKGDDKAEAGEGGEAGDSAPAGGDATEEDAGATDGGTQQQGSREEGGAQRAALTSNLTEEQIAQLPVEETPRQQPQFQPKETSDIPVPDDLAQKVAEANVRVGEKQTRRCQSCHTFEKGGKNRTGPNLWGIVGAPVAHLDDFKYSKAMLTHGGTWTLDNLYRYIKDPKGYIPRNKMAFAGLKNEKFLIDLLAYLQTLKD